ncbi:MAG: hypothetical protein IKC01_02365, partial [Clostridia bacterium]|nr:hypothetical protein [Clostridia bacterium]
MKKVISVILSVILLSITVVPAFAAEENCNCGQPPIIYVAALGSGTLTLDEGLPGERVLFRPDTAYVISELTPVISAAGNLINDGDYDAFGDVLIECVNKIFGDLALDNEGNSSPRVTCEEFHPTDEVEHSIDHNYYFGYDFRLDPIENAKKLYDFVQEVKELTKHDTVRFRASSMGGVTTMSYIKLYGTADIETIIFQCCPLLGTAVAGELYTGKVELNTQAVERYAAQAMPELENDLLGGIVYMLLEGLTVSGLLDDFIAIGDDLVYNLKDRVFNECLIPIFATMPGIWSFVPHEYYEEAKIFMQLDSEKHAKLIEKLDFYHYDVQQSAESLLNSAKANGTTIYNVVGYNMQRTPIVSAYSNDSDGTVDTKYASMGATCADITGKLPEDYIQQKHQDVNYISPDWRIDASTCILPESTWFIKDMMHSSTHDGHDDLYKWMFLSEEQQTVFDNPDYPQFMQNDVSKQRFIPVIEERGTLGTSFDNFFRMPSFINLIDLITKIFKFFYK